MKDRCLNPNNQNYKDYGGRGITIYHTWVTSFADFLKDMGERPSKEMTIERENNDGNYEPGNCKWASRGVQGQNRRPKRTERLLTALGETMNMTSWAKTLKVGVSAIGNYLRIHPNDFERYVAAKRGVIRFAA